jgi:hypothetical protein
MNILIQREILTPIFTAGKFFIDGNLECCTLEDTVREPGIKIPKKTAIPAGKYRLVCDFSSRFQRMMPHILNVPGFEGIRIHAGNTEEDTEGCILVGRERQDGGRVITYSRSTFDDLFSKIFMCGDKDCWIEIKNPGKPTESENLGGTENETHG